MRRRLQIQNRLGLHARAAAVFVKAAGAYQARISIATAEKTADAKSIMSVMTLGAALGTEITLEACGEDAAEALAALEAVIKDRFGEED